MIEELLFNENDVVPIGTVIARIRTDVSENISAAPPPPPPQKEYAEANAVEDIPYVPSANMNAAPSNGVRFYSPLVLNIAQSEGISMTELENIPGTGQDGRVSKKDIITYAKEQQFPIIPCNLCGSQENLARRRIKKLIMDLATENPKVPSNILHALNSVHLSQLMDRNLWDFKHLEKQRININLDNAVSNSTDTNELLEPLF